MNAKFKLGDNVLCIKGYCKGHIGTIVEVQTKINDIMKIGYKDLTLDKTRYCINYSWGVYAENVPEENLI